MEPGSGGPDRPRGVDRHQPASICAEEHDLLVVAERGLVLREVPDLVDVRGYLLDFGDHPLAGEPARVGAEEDAGIPTAAGREDLVGELVGLRAEIHDQRHHLLGVHQLGERPEELLGHPGAGDRSDRIGLDVVFHALDREDVGQAHDPRLGRAVVGLTEVAEQPRCGCRVHEPAVSLLLHHPEGRMRHVEGATEMDVDHGVDFVESHVGERAVAQDPCVVDDDVDRSEGVEGGGHDRGATLTGGHRVVVGHCLTARAS